MASVVIFQSMAVCMPATSAVAETISRVSLPSAVVNPKWGQQKVSLKASSFSQSLRRRGARQFALAQLSEFAVQESRKFREGLLQQLEANPTTAGEKVKIADICAKIFGNYVEKYDGSLSPEPFGEMKAALDSQNLPASEKVICAALGWSRGHLHNDWKTSQEKK